MNEDIAVGDLVLDEDGYEGVVAERYSGMHDSMRGWLCVKWADDAGSTWEPPTALTKKVSQ